MLAGKQVVGWRAWDGRICVCVCVCVVPSTVLVHTEFVQCSAASMTEYDRMNGLPRRGYSGRVEECKKNGCGRICCLQRPRNVA